MSLTLTHENAVAVLCEYLEVAQRKGSYTFPDAAALKEVVDDLTGPKKVFEKSRIAVAERGLVVGQSKGAFSLTDAHVINQVLAYVAAELEKEPSTTAVDFSKGKDIIRD